MKKLLTPIGVICAAVVLTLGAVAAFYSPPKIVFKPNTGKVQTMYVRNLSRRFIKDSTIVHDIPAWEQAVNVDVSKYWNSAQYKLIFIGRKQAPYGSEVMTFVDSGPVKGALAYHTVFNGAPSITIYAGTGVYYGFNNSISATHELEELAADPFTSTVQQGWPYDYYWLEKPDGTIKQNDQYGVVGWFGEVSDPVESDFYSINGVAISDFITPAWFNSGGGSRYDFMGVCPQPFWIRPGGYAQYLNVFGWNLVENFRGGGADARGFFLGDTSRG